MNNHESIMKDVLKEKQLLDKISPKFQQLNELDEIMEQADNPKVLAALMFRLIQEKEKTNSLLENINEKYDKIMFSVKTQNPLETNTQESRDTQFEVLPEQDQMILKIVEEQGQCTAKDIKTMLSYKGLNAACQRLNKLYKEGYLKKVKSGRKVLYLAKC
ncbi:MAG: hypothetical protein NUV57_01230 [archaeon]|nr:hypothetical protein [archaeon]